MFINTEVGARNASLYDVLESNCLVVLGLNKVSLKGCQ